MPKTEFYQIYNPADLDDLTNQLNSILNQLSDRIDKMEGIRGTTTIQEGITVEHNSEIVHGINTDNEDDANN